MAKFVYLFPFLAGMCVCFQGTMNGYWQSRIGVHSTIFINGVVVALLTGLFFMVANRTSIEQIGAEVKPWVVLNGLCGFTILLIAALTFPRIGASSVIVLMLSGQLAMALAVDHFGVLNIPQHPVSLLRLAGVAFVFLGVLLTVRY